MPLVNQIAIVSDTPQLGFDELSLVTAAIQKQVSRDLVTFWEIDASIAPFARLELVPVGYWPVIIRDDIGFDTAGIHCDKHGNPISLVSSGPGWSVTASHEVLEMLVDPFGRRTIAGQSPLGSQGRVEFLVEVADPVTDCHYPVNDVTVSDFYTPHYFDPVAVAGVRYTCAGNLSAPRQISRGGYLTWQDPVSDSWWQQSWFEGGAAAIRSLGKVEDILCGTRAAVDAITARHRTELSKPNRRRTAKTPSTQQAHPQAPSLEHSAAASRAKAAAWRTRLDEILHRANKTG